jgi:KDZ transposase family protein
MQHYLHYKMDQFPHFLNLKYARVHQSCIRIALTHARCHIECRTRYHHNYFIHSLGASRTYYHSVVPPIMHLSTKFFMETTLCELFANMTMQGRWTVAPHLVGVLQDIAGREATAFVLGRLEGLATHALATAQVSRVRY